MGMFGNVDNLTFNITMMIFIKVEKDIYVMDKNQDQLFYILSKTLCVSRLKFLATFW